jgi:Flp pilus assembly protein TadB
MKQLHPISISAILLVVTSLACRPVFAIGWTELAIILVILVVLFAPLLIRLFRLFIRSERSSKKNEQ